jgi:prolyl oligopeptidase PreP (S9A serine peptidase family)
MMDLKAETLATVTEVPEEKRVYHRHDHQNKQLKIICAGHSKGKTHDNCEDSYFTSERSFGVADGVSGWNDFGFSSKEFADQLMTFSKAEVEGFDATSSEK